jgi:hypothetical protein
VPEHEELDVPTRGRAAHQQGQSEHVPEDQIQQPQQHGGDHAETDGGYGSPLVSSACHVLEPHTPPTAIPRSPDVPGHKEKIGPKGVIR